ncbi:ABC transporter permease [Neobacillus sp. PS3-40]|uniref:ABC transporter permease n=1 Tax=Neobacillus sp. PS3-40 TaxID=3070679 RepID=UPI0027DED83C|nr:ABC transporter permease [Neobacillus sp. PS3-40]WML46149.1 ABC transporter permease [Neobacillus sp. PS3-40]
MSQFIKVFKYTYIENVKTKAFILSTILILLLEGLVLSLPRIIEDISGKDKSHIAVMDETDQLVLNSDKLGSVMKGYSWKVVDKGEESSLRKDVVKGDLDGLFILRNGDSGSFIEYIAAYQDETLIRMFQYYIQTIYTSNVIKENSINKDTAQALLTQVPMKITDLAKKQEDSFLFVYGMIFFMYIAILGYGQAVATAVASEKSSRVMEIMITKVKPIRMMFGKVLGVGSASLSQLLLIILSTVLMYKSGIVKSGGDIFGFKINLDSVTTNQVVYFVLFFILGYFVYAALYAAFGAMVSRIEDLTNITLPLSLTIIMSFLLAMYTLSSPNGIVSKVASFIPFFSPVSMFTRISISTVSPLEIVLSVMILVITMILVFLFASKVYPTGVLLYGKKPKLKNVLKNSN